MTFSRASAQGERDSAPVSPPSSPSSGAQPGAPSVAIDRLTYRSAAETWPEGSAPLVRWLRANPEALTDLLGTALTDTSEEVAASDAAVFADPAGTRMLVVVEVGESSDATFGQLMTRMTASKAQGALWICGSARADHIAAVSWLNRMADGRFFIARVRAARIGASSAAPALDLVLRPPRAGDGGPPADGAPEPTRLRRAEDWRELALPETAG